MPLERILDHCAGSGVFFVGALLLGSESPIVFGWNQQVFDQFISAVPQDVVVARR